MRRLSYRSGRGRGSIDCSRVGCVALVLVGLGLGALHQVPDPHLTKGLLFAVILPGLLFEASFNMDAREF